MIGGPRNYLTNLKNRLLAPKPSQKDEEPEDPIAEARRTVKSYIDAQTDQIDVEGWMKHPFTRKFMAKLESEADAAHLKVARAEMSSETYRAVFELLVALYSFPLSVVVNGREAGAKLTELREDGTLEELDNLGRGRSS